MWRRTDTAWTLERSATLCLGLYLTGCGWRALAAGRWLYSDLLGVQVPALLAVVVGGALVVLALLPARFS